MTTSPGEAPRDASSHLSPDEAIRNFLKYLPESCRLLVAFSGGGDSTGLLAALADARGSRPDTLHLHAATVDHGLRAGSAQEAEAAGRMSRKLGVPHSVLSWTGAKPLTGIQAAARAARYSLLAAEASRVGADLVVTGHNLDDQLETIAMRRLRNPLGEVGMDDAVLVERSAWVVRPFLRVRRQSIRDFLQERRLSWSEDPSNENLAFERVRIRRAGIDETVSIRQPDHASSAIGAQFVRDHVRVYAAAVIVVELSDFHILHRPFSALLMTLISILGGREHGPSSDVAENVIAKIVDGGDFRCTAGRVVLDRRKSMLYLCREARGLEAVTILPGEKAVWDGRYEIGNSGQTSVTIAAGGVERATGPLFPIAANAPLPKGVAALASTSMPHLMDGDIRQITVRPVLAPFEHFLPQHRLMLANSLAEAFGMEHFPPLPLCVSPFNT